MFWARGLNVCVMCRRVCGTQQAQRCYNGVVNQQKGKTMDNNNSQRNSINKWLDKHESVLGAFMWGLAIGIALWRIPQLFALGIW